MQRKIPANKPAAYRVPFVQEAFARSYAQLNDTKNDTMLAPIYDLESTTIIGAVTISKAVHRPSAR